jgi:drug/metabolite transporter (DMT)-like permease
MWMTVTVAAAIFQTSRTAMQQRLRSLLSVSGAGFVRYVWGAPIACSAVAIIAITGHKLPTPAPRFWPLIAGGGIAQIVATIFLISAFDARGFAVGTVYSKTEVVQVAVFSAVLLDESLRPLGWLSTVLCMAGVVLLAGGRTILRHPDRAALLGLLAGTGFGLAAVGIRAATQALGTSNAFVRAIVALAVMNTMQTVIHGGYLALRQRDFWLHERNTRREFAGAALVLAGVMIAG